MPPGVPVATVSIGGGANAAILATQILATHHTDLRARLKQHKIDMEQQVALKSYQVRCRLFMSKLPIAVLASGYGSNLQSIIDQSEQGTLPVQIQVVIADKADAFALQRAKKHGIKSFFVDRQQFASRLEFDMKLHQILSDAQVDLIVLAGFMRLLSQEFVKLWKHKIINVHPSLLPAFPGLHAIQKALDYGTKITGASVFFVDEGIDTGILIAQSAVPIHDDDTLETLTTRIQEQERIILPQAIDRIAKKQIQIQNRHVKIKEI